MNFPPQGRSRPLAPPFLTCASDAIPFSTCTVAESIGSLIQGRTSLLTTQAGLVL